jgi:hypothetical protein
MAKGKRIGRCIYCGSTHTPLRREHAIPAGIGGDLYLDEASCQAHADVTSRFEGEVLGNSWFAARQAMGFRTAHKARPRLFPIQANAEREVASTINVSLEEYWPILAFPIFAPPGHLLGQDVTGITLLGFAQTTIDDVALQRMVSKYGQEVSVTYRFDAHAFPRMLAKIAYVFAVGVLGPESIGQTYVLPAILGTDGNPGMWVGSAPGRVLSRPDHLHSLKLWVHNGEVYVRVALFANRGAPEYLVIVGRLAESSVGLLFPASRMRSNLSPTPSKAEGIRCP